MSKPDWKALALSLVAHSRSLSRAASAPNWMAPNYAIVPKTHLDSLENVINRVEEAMKSGAGAVITTPPACPTNTPYNPTPWQPQWGVPQVQVPVAPWGKQLQELYEKNAQLERQVGNLEQQLKRVDQNIETVAKSVTVMKKLNKFQREKGKKE